MERPALGDRYEVLDRIGQGGMATVWRARDKASQSEVAIKVLLPHLYENEMVVERFKREMAAVRRIDHPGVVQVFDLIQANDLLALVLEYHHGLDLKRIIRRRGALPPNEVIDLGSQLLDALGAAHERGVIHRDVKPQNVLVGEGGRAKLTDFGLARVDDLVRVTAHTIAFGSPEYVAPELLGTDVVDQRADLYSLGVTLFEAATGKLPFRADSPLALVKLHETGERPNMAELDLPEALARSISRALARDPDDRFPTADAMKRALCGEPIALVPKSTIHCAKCGAPLVAGLPHCVECDHRPVRIRGGTRGGRRLQLEPRRRRDRNRDVLTFEQKAKLMKLLREMGALDNLEERALDQRLKEIPVVLADRLSDGEAAKLAEQLAREGFDVSIGWRGFLGTLATLFQMRSSIYALLVYAFVFGPAFVVIATSILGWTGEWMAALLYFAGLFFAGGVWMLTLLARAAPVVSFQGRPGLERSNDPLAVRAAGLFAKIRTSRLRNLLRRVLNRGFALDTPRTNELVEGALREAERIAELEESMQAIDAHAITDRVQTLEERIQASLDSFETNELIEEKHRLLGDLGALDEKQEEAARCYGRLLQISSELAKTPEKG